jgi:hypothetical protein
MNGKKLMDIAILLVTGRSSNAPNLCSINGGPS